MQLFLAGTIAAATLLTLLRASDGSTLLETRTRFKDNMCPNSNPDRKRCVDMAPADWFIACETSFVSDRQDLNETLFSYSILKRIVEETILEWRNLFEKAANTDNGHRLGYYFTDKNFKVLKDICGSWDTKTGDSLKLPIPDQLKHMGHESKVPTLLREIEKQFSSCVRPVQRIVILFVQKVPNTEIHKNWILGVLGEWRRITDVTVQVYVVVVSQVKDNLWTSLHTHHDRLGTDGDIFFNTYFKSTAALESGTAQRVLHCACTKSRECRTATSIAVPCHFTRRPAPVNEACLRNVSRTFKFVAQPERVDRKSLNRQSCLAKFSTPCDNSECMKDCNLKTWGPWSSCYFVNPKRGHIKHRSRVNSTGGGHRYSEWTNSCRKQEVNTCVKPTGPTKKYDKLTTIPLPLLIEDYSVETVPLPTATASTSTEATTTIQISTTTEWIVLGMSFPILIVAATAACIISFACCIVATLFVVKGQGEPKRRVVVLDGGKLKKRSNFASVPPPRLPTTSAPSQEEYDYGGGGPYAAATASHPAFSHQSQGYSQPQQPPPSRSYDGEWDYGEPQPRSEWPAPRRLQRPLPTSQRPPSNWKKAQARQSKVAATYGDLQPPTAYKKSAAAATPGYMTLKGFHTGSTARKALAPKKGDAQIGAYMMY